MASGINNTFRQVGIATGIAALGAIFQSRIQSHIATSGAVPARLVHPFAQAVASGGTNGLIERFADGSAPPPQAVRAVTTVAHSAFISGLNEILFVAAFVLFAGAILVFLLVRKQDFVASGPAAAGH